MNALRGAGALPGSPLDSADRLLRRYETGQVDGNFAKAQAEAVPTTARLELARAWIELSWTSGDPRFLNGVLKIVDAAGSSAAAREVARLARACLEELPQWLRRPSREDWEAKAPPFRCSSALSAADRVFLLAGRQSTGALSLLERFRTEDCAIGGVILCPDGRGPSGPGPWYPPFVQGDAQPNPRHEPIEVVAARGNVPCWNAEGEDWTGIAAFLRERGAELAILAGMGIVPAILWSAPKLGTINAHNGALPEYRGMDAVAWACLFSDPVTCTVHRVVRGADKGDIITHRRLDDPWTVPNLRARVKEAQTSLLASVVQSALWGPVAVHPQPEAGVQYYRMHPALRMHLDQRFAT